MEAKSLGFKIYFFENRGLENPKNGLYAESNSGYNPFVRILIAVTQLEHRFFFFEFQCGASYSIRIFDKTVLNHVLVHEYQ